LIVQRSRDYPYSDIPHWKRCYFPKAALLGIGSDAMQIRLLEVITVVSIVIAGSENTLAGTCPPGYQPAPTNVQQSIQNQQQGGVIYSPPSPSTAPSSGYGTQSVVTSGGGSGGFGYATSGCVPIAESNKNRNVGTTPTGKTTTQTQPNKNRAVPVTPTGK
jgi:hypothetical protein